MLWPENQPASQWRRFDEARGTESIIHGNNSGPCGWLGLQILVSFFLSTTLLGIHWANASITGARGRANSITLTHTANGRHAVWLLGGPLAVHKGLLMI